jgi:hypothetical protein
MNQSRTEADEPSKTAAEDDVRDVTDSGRMTDDTSTPTQMSPNVIQPQYPDIDPPDDPDPLDPRQFQTYENRSFGCSLRYPEDWTIDNSVGLGINKPRLLDRADRNRNPRGSEANR